jgi:hypothetical protein
MSISKIFWGFLNLFLQNLGLLSPKKRKINKERLETCYKCGFAEDKFCSICGCYIPAKTKANYDKDEEGKSIGGCPMRYW